MEEKERFELFGEHCIKDNNPDARCQLLDAYKACVTLNEQDKENQQLKQQLAENGKEIEKINACVDFYKSYYISFKGKVIDELEKVKAKLVKLGKDYSLNWCGIKIYNFIDDQINELKEGK